MANLGVRQRYAVGPSAELNNFGALVEHNEALKFAQGSFDPVLARLRI